MTGTEDAATVATIISTLLGMMGGIAVGVWAQSYIDQKKGGNSAT